ncbi:IS110 family transposase [Saccharopolyspora sp. NPDC050389]|uniref:IS110 family transposase n=1 Tax=Saccharopolyspora sp. NPDC050389 TaxID=3155516 RepID=UPI0033CBB68B
MVAEVRRLDRRITTADTDIATTVEHTGTTLTQLYGIGTGLAGTILARVGSVHRFRSAAAFASYTGTAPIEVSSGDVKRHRLSRAGDRQLNHALHMMALSQIRHNTEGRAYYRRKRAGGKSHKEAMRCLKRRLSDTVYRQLLHDADLTLAAGPAGHSGAALSSSAAD